MMKTVNRLRKKLICESFPSEKIERVQPSFLISITMSQYEAMCDNDCGTQLSEDVHIHCLSKGDEEMTFCTVCRDDLWDSLKKEGWICCDEDCE